MIWLAPNIALQVVGRILQGFAAAIVWITGLAMIADTVGQEDVGQYLSYLGVAMMVGT
jgi:predicted MFS family arabinose efflux permease